MFAINGVTKSVPHDYIGQMAVYNFNDVSAFYLDAIDIYLRGTVGTYDNIGMASYVPNGTIQKNVDRAFSLGNLANDYQGFFQFQRYDESTHTNGLLV